MVTLCENKIYSNNSDNVIEMICKESYEDVSLYIHLYLLYISFYDVILKINH